MIELGIIADDLTGAMDTGVQFAKQGLHTVVMLCAQELPSAKVVALSTDSRDEPAAEAYHRAKQAAEQLHGRFIYKKIDSNLRGNIGPELDGVLDGLGLQRALVVPAFPAAGRTTVDGYHWVDGVLLSESAFARDPLWPATESHLPTVLARQTHRSVGYLPLSVIERGEQAVIRALMNEPASIVAADAAEQRHLRVLALALAHMEEKWLPCGSGGWAEEWPHALGCARENYAPSHWPPDPRPVLVVAGSRHPATLQQLQRAASDSNLRLMHLPAREDWAKRIQEAISWLNRGHHVALTTAFSEYQRGEEKMVAEALAQAAAKVLALSPVAGLVVTGGDIVRALCK
ncbi:MAG: hypothetical protein H5T63_05950, partial [Chloroflexi bacterium]|nr:hypothetical protein [Chloroflexota bacterium]